MPLSGCSGDLGRRQLEVATYSCGIYAILDACTSKSRATRRGQRTCGEHVQDVGGRAGGIPEFEWDENNEQKLLDNHGVSAWEVEQCFANPHTRRRQGDALLMLGKTDGDRMLFLVYEQKANGVVRVYSAREMTDKERRAYRQNAR